MSSKSEDTPYAIRRIVISKYASGMSGDRIAKTLDIKRSTVYRIIWCYKYEDRIAKKARTGRPAKLFSHDKRFIMRTATRNPKVSGPQIRINGAHTKYYTVLLSCVSTSLSSLSPNVYKLLLHAELLSFCLRLLRL